MAPTIHLVRHAQGFHNLSVESEQLHDPDLTPKGLEQCATLRSIFPYHSKVTKLITSPLRRTIYTCLRSFSPSPEPGHQDLLPVAALDLLQEVSNSPCDTGTETEALQKEFAGLVDFSDVREGWLDKGTDSDFEPRLSKLNNRGKLAREWLKKRVEGDEHVVVVLHGGFMHFLTDDWTDIPEGRATGWDNCEFRSYQFMESSGGAEELALVETQESRSRRTWDAKPLTSTEKTQLKSITQQKIRPFLHIVG